MKLTTHSTEIPSENVRRSGISSTVAGVKSSKIGGHPGLRREKIKALRNK
jgi:hypothetical protein